MAQHHLVDRPVAEAVPRDRLGRAGADSRQIVPRLGRSERLDFPAHRAWRLERVVALRQVWPQQLEARVAMGQPQVLVGGDVAEIPDERAHDRRVHALQVLVAESGDQRERARAGLVKIGERLCDARRSRRAVGRELVFWRAVVLGMASAFSRAVVLDMALGMLTRPDCSL